MDKKKVAARALSLLDLTSLNDGDTEDDIKKLCANANGPWGKTAAVCVWAKFVPLCKELLAGSGVKIATVVNFPEGSTNIEKTVEETKAAVADGADEIDVVFPYKAYLEGDKDVGKKLVQATRDACGDKAKLKVIIESGELEKAVYISEASRISIEAGADFIKTSTGKVPVSATPEAANAMLEAIRDTGQPVGFKASGGIKTTEQAGDYMALADSIMGPDWISAGTFRFGASSILVDLKENLGFEAGETAKGGY